MSEWLAETGCALGSVTVDFHEIALFYDKARDGFSVVEFHGGGAVLIGDDLARLYDGFEEVVGAEFVADSGEVGTDGSAFTGELVATGARRRRGRGFARLGSHDF